MSFSRLLLATSLISGAAFAQNGIDYNDAYARATPPKAVNSAVFMTIENSMSQERSLVSVESDIAKKTELHTVEKDGDLMKMRQVDSIAIPANGSVELKPGSFHIMLLDVAQPLKEGSEVTLTLTYQNGEKEELTVPVKKVMAGMKMKMDKEGKHDHMHMDH